MLNLRGSATIESHEVNTAGELSAAAVQSSVLGNIGEPLEHGFSVDLVEEFEFIELQDVDPPQAVGVGVAPGDVV